MTLGYFAFRQDLPLALRSALYPIFGERVHGLVGDFVDGFGILATVISLVTNLGIGALVLVSGICYLIPEIPHSSATLITAVLIMMFVATVTTVIGIEKGLAWLSRINLRLLYALLLFVFLTGPTNHLLNGLVQNTGDYLNNFMGKSFDMYLYNQKPVAGWVHGLCFIGHGGLLGHLL